MMIIRIQLLAENQFKYSTFPSINIPSFQNDFFFSYLPKMSPKMKSKSLSEVGFEPTPPNGDQNTRTLRQRKLCLSLAP